MAPKATIPRSSFDRSHALKTTCNSGLLVPIFVDEVLPGDTHTLRANVFGRMATPIKPIFDNVFLDTFFFFVPNRLVWENWQKFNGEQDNPGDSTDFTIPKLTGGVTPASESLLDYFGLPTGVGFTGLNPTSSLPFRAYNLIYNEWFRDQNLQDSIPVQVDDGDDTTGQYLVRRRGKRHDYFTSCLPWPQKGEAVIVPLGTEAPVYGDPNAQIVGVEYGRGGPLATMRATGSGTSDAVFLDDQETGINQLYADLSANTGVSINTLRQSFQIQKLLERDARGGTRYTEIVRSHFGVVSPDARLQRPEFLGGGTSMVNINPVAQTQASVIDGEGGGTVQAPTAQGNLAAFATVSASNHGFTKSFTEHGFIIGLVNFRADLTYQQGLNRMWSREGRYDFYWPALAHIGEQAVLGKEIYVDGTNADNEVFGYQERYAEYRYKPSQITGKFRSQDAESLDVWHLAQEFADRPVLGASFIEDNPPINRVIAVQDEPQFLLDVWFNYRSVRPMPTYGTPGLIDHF